MSQNNDNKLNLLKKKEEILNFLKSYNIKDFEVQEGEKEEWIVIKLKNNHDKKKELTIDMAYELNGTSRKDMVITIFYEGWHSHYNNDKEEYELFKEDIQQILNNEKFIVNTYYKDKSGNEIFNAFLSETAIPNGDELRDEVDEKIECIFWDSKKNVTFPSITNN